MTVKKLVSLLFALLLMLSFIACEDDEETESNKQLIKDKLTLLETYFENDDKVSFARLWSSESDTYDGILSDDWDGRRELHNPFELKDVTVIIDGDKAEITATNDNGVIPDGLNEYTFTLVKEDDVWMFKKWITTDDGEAVFMKYDF